MTEATVSLELGYAGLCRHAEGMVVRGAPWRSQPFPALFGVIRHVRHGVTLFDTGYTDRFHHETQGFPSRLYRWLTPPEVAPEETAVAQLAKLGLRASDVRRVVVSHFHADHVAGLRDFPDAELLATREALASVRGRGVLGTLAKGFLPGLLPDDFDARARLLEHSEFAQKMGDFDAHDLFGDGSVLLVQLPGHAAGQIGLLARTPTGRRFLVADAAWTSASFRENRAAHPIAGLIFDDAAIATRTLASLHALTTRDPTLDIIPSHCRERARELTGKAIA